MHLLSNEYVAGLFDGEGCVSFYLREQRTARGALSPMHRMMIRIGMTNKPILNQIRRQFGGSICPQKVQGNRKPAWAWARQGKSAVAFLNAIEPYAVIKKQEVRLALRFASTLVYEHPREGQTRSAPRVPMNVLRLRGKIWAEAAKIKGFDKRRKPIDLCPLPNYTGQVSGNITSVQK